MSSIFRVFAQKTTMYGLALPLIIGTLSACGSGSGKSCSSIGDCEGGYLCLATSTGSACAPTCSASVNECGASATCGQVGILSVSACQPTPAPATGTTTMAKAVEQPKVPCKTDAECASVQPGTVCASFKGARDCTIPCTAPANCVPPAVGGVTVRFLTCSTDEGQNRQVCLPDPACLSAPTSCVSGLSGSGGPGSLCGKDTECTSGSCMISLGNTGFCK